jgi:hypothetical protein
MKKMAIMMIVVSMSCNAMESGFPRFVARRVSPVVLVASVGWMLWYNKKNTLNSKPVNALDKEIIIQFYATNPDSKQDRYQQLKKEARDDVSLWHDVFICDPIRSKGNINEQIMHNMSHDTTCKYQYVLNPLTGLYYLSRYDCTTCLSRMEVKKCIKQAFEEGMIE